MSLCRLQRDGKYSNLEADAAIRKFKLEGAERALYTKLFYGVTERRLTLDYFIEKYSGRNVESLSLEMLSILRAAMYQLIYLDRVPDYAAINEAVELSKKYERLSAASFTNAVCRRLTREGHELPEDDGTTGWLSLAYSVSPEICGLFEAQYGREETKKLLSSLFYPQFLTLRVNTLKNTPAQLVGKLKAAGIPSRITETGTGVTLDCFSDVEKVLTAADGGGYIQDGASQFCVKALDARAGMTLVDVCAAPGGKTVSAAVDMENSGRIYAFDIHENKLKLILQTAEACGVNIITAEKRDGRQPDAALFAQADRVLCDVPCSGLGVLAKKPEQRYRPIGELSALYKTQREILCESVKYLKPDGRLVYSTCTLNREENEDAVSEFLRLNPCYTLENEKTLFPHINHTDGFYYAVIKKERE